MSRTWLPHLLVVLALAAGAWLRLAHLDARPFATDEAIQYYAARGLLETGRPVLPSGVPYERGIDYTRLAAPLLARGDSPETAMRLPAAILGTLALVAFTVIGWALGGPWVALWCTVLLGLYPEAVLLSRFGRFYALQLALGLIAFYAGWKAFTPAQPGNRRALMRQWAWIALALAAFLAATRVQVTTLTVVLAWMVLLGGQALVDWRRHGRAAWRWSGALQATTLFLITGVILVAAGSAAVAEFAARARAVPLWARLGATGNEPTTFYYRALSTSWPIGISLLPVATIWLLLRRARLAVYLAGWFGVALLVHSLVLPWKQERYILLAVPAWLLLLALAATAAGAALHGFLVRATGGAESEGRIGAGALAALVAVTVVITQPAFNTARRMPHAGDEDGWRASAAILHQDPVLGALPLAATSPLPALHYWGRLDFTVQPALRERWSGSGYALGPPGTLDVYAGVPVLTSPGEIRAAFPGRAGVVIGIDQKYIVSHNIDPALVDTLEHRATELCRGRCGTMRLYRWGFQARQ